MDSKQSKEYDDLVERVYDLEEDVQRLDISNDITYDKKFHSYVIEKYSKLTRDVIDSSLTFSSKAVLIEMIKAFFEQVITNSNITLDD